MSFLVYNAAPAEASLLIPIQVIQSTFSFKVTSSRPTRPNMTARDRSFAWREEGLCVGNQTFCSCTAGFRYAVATTGCFTRLGPTGRPLISASGGGDGGDCDGDDGEKERG
jgi:hypothetical protein